MMNTMFGAAGRACGNTSSTPAAVASAPRAVARRTVRRLTPAEEDVRGMARVYDGVFSRCSAGLQACCDSSPGLQACRDRRTCYFFLTPKRGDRVAKNRRIDERFDRL